MPERYHSLIAQLPKWVRIGEKREELLRMHEFPLTTGRLQIDTCVMLGHLRDFMKSVSGIIPHLLGREIP
jgi:hypothetical protein